MYVFKNTIHQDTGESAKTVFRGTGELEIGSPPEFDGKPGILSPEEMFVGAINGCLMTTFFYFARKANIEISSYYSDAEGQVEKAKDGFRFINVEVRAKVTLSQQSFAEKVRELGSLAEKYCLVSHSVACPVRYYLEVETK